MTDEESRLERLQMKEDRREKRRREREKIASLHGKKRLQYLWDYYKFVLVAVIVAAVAVNIAVTMIRGAMTDKILQVAALSTDYEARDETMKADFADYIGGLKKHQELSFDLTVAINPGKNTQAAQVSDMKLQVMVASGAVDAVLVPEETLPYLQQRGMLMELDDVLDSRDIRDYERNGDLAYADPPDLEALSEAEETESRTMDPDMENSIALIRALNDAQDRTETGTATAPEPEEKSAETEATAETEAASEAEAASGPESAAEAGEAPPDQTIIRTARNAGQRLYGVRVDDSGVLSKYAWYPAGKRIYFGIVSDSAHTDMALAYLDFLKGVSRT